MADAPIPFFDLTRAELAGLAVAWGFSPVHAGSLWGQVYLRGITDWDRMDVLPPRFRRRAAQELRFVSPVVDRELHSTDGFTRKYLLRLGDGRTIETVLMRFTGRVTACVSSQAGCAMGCVFCATGQAGFTRHLSAGEIVAQAMHVDTILRGLAGEDAPLARPRSASPHERHERLRNVVLMGMGEPLHNYEAVVRAVDILRDSCGLGLAAGRITVSTVGVVPGIVRLADERRPFHLAVSLHAATQAERAALVPVASRWPLPELMKACRYYSEILSRRIFYEWTLIRGRNDTLAQARELARLLRGQQAQVNLIPLNPTGGYGGEPTERETARRFQEVLREHGIPSTVRQRRGIDIAAGCGQLAARE